MVFFGLLVSSSTWQVWIVYDSWWKRNRNSLWFTNYFLALTQTRGKPSLMYFITHFFCLWRNIQPWAIPGITTQQCYSCHAVKNYQHLAGFVGLWHLSDNFCCGMPCDSSWLHGFKVCHRAPSWTHLTSGQFLLAEKSIPIIMSSTCTCHNISHSLPKSFISWSFYVCPSYLSLSNILFLVFFLPFLFCKLRRSQGLWSTRRLDMVWHNYSDP